MRAICAAASILTTAACRWMQCCDPPLTRESRRNVWALNAAQIASLSLSNPHADFCCCGFCFCLTWNKQSCPLNSRERWRASMLKAERVAGWFLILSWFRKHLGGTSFIFNLVISTQILQSMVYAAISACIYPEYWDWKTLKYLQTYSPKGNNKTWKEKYTQNKVY